MFFLRWKCLFLFVCFLPLGGEGGEVAGSPKKNLLLSARTVLKETLRSSLFVKKLDLEKQKAHSLLKEREGAFSTWNLFSNYSHTQRKNPPISLFESRQSRIGKMRFGLQKTSPYGLTMESGYSRVNERHAYTDFLRKSKAPDQFYRQEFGFQLSANPVEALSNHWIMEAIGQARQTSDWLYYEKSEELALRALQQYWKAYLSHLAYNQAQQSVKTYKKLVRQIQNKKKYGFLKPGEAPQILAEYQNIQQEEDKQKQNQEREKKALLILLNKDPLLYDVSFEGERLVRPPALPKLSLESVRPVKIRRNQIREGELQLKASQLYLFPGIQLFGRGGFIPGGTADEKSAFSKHFFYELGLNLNWSLFSKSAYEKTRQEKYTLEESKIDMEILKRELVNQSRFLEREIDISYKNALRADKANSYQKKAFRELTRSFEQGRVDVFDLIRAEGKLRESEIKKYSALSELSLAFFQLSALRDRLVEDYL